MCEILCKIFVLKYFSVPWQVMIIKHPKCILYTNICVFKFLWFAAPQKCFNRKHFPRYSMCKCIHCLLCIVLFIHFVTPFLHSSCCLFLYVFLAFRLFLSVSISLFLHRSISLFSSSLSFSLSLRFSLSLSLYMYLSLPLGFSSSPSLSHFLPVISSLRLSFFTSLFLSLFLVFLFFPSFSPSSSR